jgi:hypothetical protein
MKNLISTLIIVSTLLTSISAFPKSYTDNEIKAIHSKIIEKMIKKIKPQLDVKKRVILANYLFRSSKKYKIDPKIMVAIIDTESDFDNTKISNTGDLSLAQINTQVWNKELARLKLPTIDPKRLLKDEKYALNQMGRILSILQTRHAEKDKKWFARYHSRTQKYKQVYSKKVESRMRMIASIH